MAGQQRLKTLLRIVKVNGRWTFRLSPSFVLCPRFCLLTSLPLVFGRAAFKVQTSGEEERYVAQWLNFEPHASCPNGAASNGLLFNLGFWGGVTEARALTYTMWS